MIFLVSIVAHQVLKGAVVDGPGRPEYRGIEFIEDSEPAVVFDQVFVFVHI